MNITKRDFIKIGGGAALAGAAFPSFAAKSAKPAYGGRKVRIAAIGTGGMARGDLSNFLRTGLAEVVCAADVYEPSLDWLRKAQPKAKFYKDYRKMLAECAGTFDAVTIVVPDHSHCVAFLEAVKHKVPVFCEKPLGHTFAETVAMMREAKKAGIITHVGMQGNSFPTTQSLREWMLDWDLWQGPAVRRPYFKDVTPGHWRNWYPYGEGCMTDWVCHILGPLVTALDLDLPTAVTVDAPGFDPAKTPQAFPTSPRYKFEFPAKGERAAFTAYWYDVNRTAPRPPALEANQEFNPLKRGWSGAWVKCDKETLMYGSHGATGLRIVPQERMRAFKRPPNKYPRVRGHHEEFLRAVLENRPANTPFELAGKVSLMGLVGTIATRFPGTRLEFDAQKMRFSNCDAANRLLKPEWSEQALATYGSYI